MVRAPDYGGGSLVNLMAELEWRLGGAPLLPRLHTDLAQAIPTGDTYVLVLFDGLGADQLAHPAAQLREDAVGRIDAPFPTTTTVSMATVATGLPPSQHGLLGYQLWMPETGQVANTIKWTTLWGEALEVDTIRLLPSPNLWERLVAVGAEPITVQPGHFAGSPLSKALYRGCRYEPPTWPASRAGSSSPMCRMSTSPPMSTGKIPPSTPSRCEPLPSSGPVLPSGSPSGR